MAKSKATPKGMNDCLHCLTHGEIFVDWRDHAKGFQTCPQCGGSGFIPETIDEQADRVTGPKHWDRACEEAASREVDATRYGR